MSFKVRKFRKKTETEVRDSIESDEDTASMLLKEESSASSATESKLKEMKKSASMRGIHSVIYS